MWLFTTFGFFSVTRDTSTPNSPRLQVRSRVKGDLDLLRSSFLPELTPTIELPGRDYPYRGYCSKEQLAGAMVQITMSIDYTNYKSKVIETQGLAREQLYAQVWSVMNNAEQKIRHNEADNKRWQQKEQAGWKSSLGGERRWYDKQTTFKYSAPANKGTGPVTRLVQPDDFLNAKDLKDPFDVSSDSYDNVNDAAISNMTDEQFERWMIQNGEIEDPERTEQSDLDFLDQCANEAAEMQASRNNKRNFTIEVVNGSKKPSKNGNGKKRRH